MIDKTKQKHTISNEDNWPEKQWISFDWIDVVIANTPLNENKYFDGIEFVYVFIIIIIFYAYTTLYVVKVFLCLFFAAVNISKHINVITK